LEAIKMNFTHSAISVLIFATLLNLLFSTDSRLFFSKVK
jgi:hypothetical protein